MLRPLAPLALALLLLIGGATIPPVLGLPSACSTAEAQTCEDVVEAWIEYFETWLETLDWGFDEWWLSIVWENTVFDFYGGITLTDAAKLIAESCPDAREVLVEKVNDKHGSENPGGCPVRR